MVVSFTATYMKLNRVTLQSQVNSLPPIHPCAFLHTADILACIASTFQPFRMQFQTKSTPQHTHTCKRKPSLYERDDKLCPLPVCVPLCVSVFHDQTAGSCMSPHCQTIVGWYTLYRGG